MVLEEGDGGRLDGRSLCLHLDDVADDLAGDSRGARCGHRQRAFRIDEEMTPLEPRPTSTASASSPPSISATWCTGATGPADRHSLLHCALHPRGGRPRRTRSSSPMPVFQGPPSSCSAELTAGGCHRGTHGGSRLTRCRSASIPSSSPRRRRSGPEDCEAADGERAARRGPPFRVTRRFTPRRGWTMFDSIDPRRSTPARLSAASAFESPN